MFLCFLNSNTIYASPIINAGKYDKWCEIATFNWHSWNISSFTLFCGTIIYRISFGHEPNDNGYLTRCTAYTMNTLISKRVGFKVINNELHIYCKSQYAFTSVTCIGYCTENALAKFELKVTSLEDGDMDKII